MTQAPLDAAAVIDWLSRRLPEGFYVDAPEIIVDPEEIAILGPIAAPDTGDDGAARDAEMASIAAHRKESRALRTQLSRALSKETGKPVAWGARCGKSEQFFGSRRTPIVVRLDRTERRLLDLLVEARVARSKGDAIAWALRALEEDRAEWFAELRETVRRLEKLQHRIARSQT